MLLVFLFLFLYIFLICRLQGKECVPITLARQRCLVLFSLLSIIFIYFFLPNYIYYILILEISETTE